jgi:hypothetical protein
MNELAIDFVPDYDDVIDPDVCFGSVCVVTWHPVMAIPVNDGFKVVQAA